MSGPEDGVRHMMERRLRPDRRRGFDRRFNGRRLRFQWVENERRMLHDRRRADRRTLDDRRGYPGRRARTAAVNLPPS